MAREAGGGEGGGGDDGGGKGRGGEGGGGDGGGGERAAAARAVADWVLVVMAEAVYRRWGGWARLAALAALAAAKSCCSCSSFTGSAAAENRLLLPFHCSPAHLATLLLSSFCSSWAAGEDGLFDQTPQ